MNLFPKTYFSFCLLKAILLLLLLLLFFFFTKVIILENFKSPKEHEVIDVGKGRITQRT